MNYDRSGFATIEDAIRHRYRSATVWQAVGKAIRSVPERSRIRELGREFLEVEMGNIGPYRLRRLESLTMLEPVMNEDYFFFLRKLRPLAYMLWVDAVSRKPEAISKHTSTQMWYLQLLIEDINAHNLTLLDYDRTYNDSELNTRCFVARNMFEKLKERKK